MSVVVQLNLLIICSVVASLPFTSAIEQKVKKHSIASANKAFSRKVYAFRTFTHPLTSFLTRDVVSEISSPELEIIPELLTMSDGGTIDSSIDFSVIFNKNGVEHPLDNSNRLSFNPSRKNTTSI